MTSEAWILEKGDGTATPGTLKLQTVQVESPGPEEIIVAPLYGCLEANLIHAIQRRPVDICELRGEPFIVPGNACVARVMQAGANVNTVKAGDICMGFGTSKGDAYGYPVTVVGYDAPRVSGSLAKRVLMQQHQMIPLPANTKFSLKQWAAFSARYVSAWSNWRVASRCWKSQMEQVDPAEHFVCGWGGGVSLAELQLAKLEGFQTIMIASAQSRLDNIAKHGITPLNRAGFADLDYQPGKYHKDTAYKEAYKKSELIFLQQLHQLTGGKMIDIFIENIGQPVYLATLKALARQAVIATCGWKRGMEISYLRAVECISRHIHVHTHYAAYNEVVEAMAFAEKNGWIPDIESEKIYLWEDIPWLCDEYINEKIDSYFPVFEINHPGSLA